MAKIVTNYQNPLQQTQKVSNVKLLIFSVGRLTLALPVNSVQRVINYTPIYGSGLTPLGITHLGEQEITVIDLYRHLFHESQPVESGKKGYLILARNSMGESFAIWVAQAPTLVEVALNQVRQLPESYRRADTLQIASHVTVINEGEQSLTVFVLDADQLVPI